MGIYLNPGLRKFQRALNSQIYVDKTGLIEYANSVLETEQNCLCISRPRRFGKTMTMNMLAAYYSYGKDSTTVFQNLKIASSQSFTRFVNRYDVIFLNMLDFVKRDTTVQVSLTALEHDLTLELRTQYPDIKYRQTENLVKVLQDVYLTTERPFVILIDEWDSMFRLHPHDDEAQKLYLDFLRNLLKDQEYVALACMTGILPIKKYGEHSALNMFEEFSMENAGPLAQYVGFTAAEVQALSKQYGFSYDLLKEWYDGYVLRANYQGEVSKENITQAETYEIYNPISVVQAIRKKECVSYWTKTETYEALKRYIMLNMGGLKDIVIELMAGAHVKVNTASFANDMVTFNSTDDVLTLLIHLGYLAYDNGTQEAFIPNIEIRGEFQTAIKDEADWWIIAEAIKHADATLEATWQQDADRVARAIEKAHFETSILQYNDENALSYVLSLAYYTARKVYSITREMPAGKGFADLLFMPLPNHMDKPAMLVELKYNASAETAIQQIKKRKYLEALRGYKGKVLLVGVSYNNNANAKNYKGHYCKIEEIEL